VKRAHAGAARESVKDVASEAASGHECWVYTLQLAAGEVFELMLASQLETPVHEVASHPLTHSAAEHRLDITAVVGLAGPLCGILTIRCSERSAARMAARMLGAEGRVSNSDMWDAIGEICNMIAGHFKSKISDLGEACMLSVPTVITGADYAVHTCVNEHIRTVLLFEQAPVIFALEVHNDYPVRKAHR
jgi:chemotaxis protein CheX